MAVAAPSSSVGVAQVLERAVLQIRLISRTLVPLGERKVTCKSPIQLWVMFSPVRFKSVIVPVPAGMVRVEVTVLLSAMVFGTSVLVKTVTPQGVAVAVGVRVGVTVGVLVGGVPVTV